MSFDAKYRGYCQNCESRIEVGDLIEYTGAWIEDDALVHVECTPPVERPRVTCPVCWLIKPCECDDGAPDPEEHTDRQARHLEEDADIARINAQIEGLT